LGAAAVSFGTKYPDLLIISSLIVFYIWYDEIRHLRAVHRIASYLEVCVEPHIIGLNWETANRHHPFVTSFANRIIANAPFPTMAVVLAFYGIHLKQWPFWVGSIAIGIGVYLTILSYRTAKHGRNKEREGWQKIATKLSLESEIMPKQSIKTQDVGEIEGEIPHVE
ncbi:MAG: hypothetical protein U9N82_11710, partial [Thermodesulfobacteriota bacterium]|nr:hypothetical protein [Thermodesulfobacteriota bacterium]